MPRQKILDTIMKKTNRDNLMGSISQLHCLTAIEKLTLKLGNLKQVQTVLFELLGFIPPNYYLVDPFN